MAEEFEFEELNDDEKRLLLSVFDYSVNDKMEIIDDLLNEVVNSEDGKILTLKNVALTNGSLKMFVADPLNISRFIREKIENDC